MTPNEAITPERLHALFRPRAVALVGASNKARMSALAYKNLVDFGFADRTFLVNRRGAETHGVATVTSCREIGEPVDLAFMMVPQSGTLEALDDAAAAGIRMAVIMSSGYAETGPTGRAAQDEMVAHAAALGMVVLGPNHLGFANLVDQIPVTPIQGLPRQPGPVALLSQSGASSSAMTEFASMVGVGLSYMVTLGNEAMITAGHALDYLVDDEHTRAVAVFMESVRDPETFRRAARRAAEAGKAVVVLKAGRSELAARSAAAHTGALVGDDAVIDAVFRDLGVIRVDSIEDMMLTAGAAAHLGRLDRTGIGVVSVSGGACDIIADRAHDLGAELPALSPATEAALDGVVPEFGSVHNPLDVTGAAINDPSIFTRSIVALSDDPSMGVVMVVNKLPWIDDGTAASGQVMVDAIGAGMRQASVPCVFVTQFLQPQTDLTRSVLDAGGVPYSIPGLNQAVFALGKVGWWSDATRPDLTASPANPEGAGIPVPGADQRNGAWSERRARDLLVAAGIPVVPAELVTSAADAVRVAAGYGAPVSLKVCSPDIVHKSDIGGVQLNVTGDAAVHRGFEEVTAAGSAAPGARIEGVLVSPMRPQAVELLVGVAQDPQWGPVLAVAAGGIFVEVVHDSALAPLPVTPVRARRLVGGLRAAPLFAGARGRAPVDLDGLSAVISRIGDLALALGDRLESLEVNPLCVDGSRIEALDAVVTWRDAPPSSTPSGHDPEGAR